MSIEVLTTDDPRWDNIVGELSADFYHTSHYHQLHETEDGNQALLLVYTEEDAVIALPIIRRSLKTVEALVDNFSEYYDATSVYGYGGPISNQLSGDKFLLHRFGKAIADTFQELKIISAFSRLHPILENDCLITLGNVINVGQTVSIDLTQPEELQFKGYRSNHKRNIKKALKNDIQVYPDTNWEHYDDFIRIYNLTMDRVEAREYYYFGEEYFRNLRHQLGNVLRLFVVKVDDKLLSAGLFTLYDDIIQYHLGASDPIGMQYASSKLMMDGVRRWGNTVGAKVFHLGGGVGGSEADSLFKFKAGFSDRHHTFKIWKYIADPGLYQLATNCFEEWVIKQGSMLPKTNFFPLYRSSITINPSQ